MRKTFNQEHIVGVLCIAIGAVVLVLTKSFPGGTEAAEISGPAFFPNTLSYILILMGVYEILHGVYGKSEQFHSLPAIWKGMKTREFGNLLVICGALVVYILTVEVIGFYTISALYLYVVFWRLGVKPVKNLLSTVVFLIVIYLVFSRIFAVTLPSGILL